MNLLRKPRNRRQDTLIYAYEWYDGYQWFNDKFEKRCHNGQLQRRDHYSCDATNEIEVALCNSGDTYWSEWYNI